jgi:hypothetical protein
MVEMRIWMVEKAEETERIGKTVDEQRAMRDEIGAGGRMNGR